MEGNQYFDWVNRDHPMFLYMICNFTDSIEIIVTVQTLKGGHIFKQFITDLLCNGYKKEDNQYFDLMN